MKSSYPAKKIISFTCKLKDHRMDVFALFLCVISYFLLYLYSSQKLMSSLLEWQDYIFHTTMTRMVIEQGNIFSFFQGHPVPYPPLFHNITALISYLSGLSIEKSLIVTVCGAGCGFSFLVYLFICEISKNKLTAFLGMIFLGVGANFLTYFSSMIFFGKIYVMIMGYVIAGFLPHLLGHFLGILMLFIIVRSNLESWYYLISSIILCIMLILTHVIASITYLAALLSILISAVILKENKLVKRIIILLFIPLLISSAWWTSVLGQLMTRPYLFFLSDAGESWVSHGLSHEIVTYYGLLPLFLIFGAYKIIKNKNISIFIIFWCFLIFLLVFTPWGFRFALELVIPLYVLSAIGIITGITCIAESNLYSSIKLLFYIIIVIIVIDYFFLFDIINNLFL